MSFSEFKKNSLKIRLKFLNKINNSDSLMVSISPWAPEDIIYFKEEFDQFRDGKNYLNLKDVVQFCPQIVQHLNLS